jgi:hypothetical protein
MSTSPQSYPQAPAISEHELRGGASYGQPVPQGTNGFAITALVFGILGGILFAIIFGCIGLTQTKRTGQAGRGLAITGLVLAGVWVLGIAGIIVAAVTSAPVQY